MTDDELIEPTGDFKELAAFLDSEDAPEDWMPAAVLDGYLAGVAASPETMYPSTWLPKIWGDTPFQPEDQAHWMLAAVMNRFNYINRFVRGESPGPLWPRLDKHSDGRPDVRGWAIGFVKAISLQPEAWRPLFHHQKAGYLLAPFFSYIRQYDANGDVAKTIADAPEDVRESYLAKLLPDIVRTIHLFWIEGPSAFAVSGSEGQPHRRKVGRNEPCPCGSGRKAKRCCGAG
jgi:uncharacterized protein